MEQLQKQVLQAVTTLQQQAVVATQDLVKTIQGDFDLAPLQKILKSGTTVDEVHALITNKTVLKYAFWIVVANAVTVIAARQSLRGRNPIYTILGALACVFFAPTFVPLLTGNPITWIQNDNTVVTALSVALVTYIVGRHFLRLLPFRLIAAVLLAAANAGIIAAGWKVGQTAFKSTSGALIVAVVDSAARPFALNIEAYLKDGSLGNTKHIRSQLFAAVVYGALLLNTGNEKLALVAAFGIIAVGMLAFQLGLPINWFFPVELLLLGTAGAAATPAVPRRADAPVKQEAAPSSNNNTPSSTPSKKGAKH
jgi:hypothetical protein